MSSVLKVDEIQNTAGTSALTIDSSGRVLQPAKPAWRIGRGSSLTGVNATTTVINYDETNNANRDLFLQGGVTASSGVITVPVTGVYHVGTSNRFNNVSSSYIVIRIVKNNDADSSLGSYDIVGDGQSTNYETVGNDTLYTLTANETVKVDYYVSNDASFDIDLRAYFWGFLVG